MRNLMITAALIALLSTSTVADEYIGNYSSNRYEANSMSNPYGAGSPYNANSITAFTQSDIGDLPSGPAGPGDLSVGYPGQLH